MSDKPEALRLAESAHLGYRIEWQVKAAAELRRLHGVELALRDCEMALAKMAEKYMDAADRRDELLEALRPPVDVEMLPHVEQCIGMQFLGVERVIVIPAEQHRQLLAIPRRLAALVECIDGGQMWLLAIGRRCAAK